MKMKKDKFAQHIAAIKRHENHIATMEMLLGATWDADKQVFIKRTTSAPDFAGPPWHWTYYYDWHGVEIDGMEWARRQNVRTATEIALKAQEAKTRVEMLASRAGKSVANDMADALKYMSYLVR